MSDIFARINAALGYKPTYICDVCGEDTDGEDLMDFNEMWFCSTCAKMDFELTPAERAQEAKDYHYQSLHIARFGIRFDKHKRDMVDLSRDELEAIVDTAKDKAKRQAASDLIAWIDYENNDGEAPLPF